MKFVAIIAALGLSAASAFGADCSHIKQELEAMREAQHTLLISLANNHETFASSFEEVNTELEMNHMRIPAPFLSSMRKTATAFRTRGVKAKSSAEKLDTATAELIDEVMRCLK